MALSRLHDVVSTLETNPKLTIITVVGTTGALLLVHRILKCLSKKNLSDHKPDDVMRYWDYESMKGMIKTSRISLPAMFVDINIFDANIQRLVQIVKPTGKTLRIATKSIRCPDLIKRIIENGQGVMRGLMCYSVFEAALLADEGLDDFYIPYPTLQYADVDQALQVALSGKTIALTVDSVVHVRLLDNTCKTVLKHKSHSYIKLRVTIDLDMSFKIGFIQLGAHRSKVDTVEKFAEIVQAIRDSQHLLLVGVMGYEAHVAGFPDCNPHSTIPNPLIRVFKKLFFSNALNFRKNILDYCKNENIDLEFFNGGGSGNIDDACADPAITEVTAGSAFLQAQLFDYYVENICSAAFCFALQATRVDKERICCQSGGFIASGSSSQDKCPLPFANPLVLSPYPDEGYGEVQTPLEVKGSSCYSGVIYPGDPVFFRPAKSGEIAEHFNCYHVKRNYVVENTVLTYRGRGKVFY